MQALLLSGVAAYLAIAAGDMIRQPVHQEPHHFDGHSGFAGSRALLLGAHLGPQACMFSLMLPAAGVAQTLHQFFLVLEVITGVADQLFEEIHKDRLALSGQHGCLHLRGQCEQPLVFLIHSGDADSVAGALCDHWIHGIRKRHKNSSFLQNSSTLSPKILPSATLLESAASAVPARSGLAAAWCTWRSDCMV